ncbi:MAG: PAS domain-containing protein [Anaerolineae bacterium]
MSEAELNKLPSIIRRVAVRFALVFAIQALVLGLLIVAVPQFMAALGEQILYGRKVAIQSLLEERGIGLFEKADAFAKLGSDAETCVRVAASMPCDTEACWAMALDGNGGLAAASAGDDLPAELRQELFHQLRQRAASGEPAWVHLYYQEDLYTVVAAKLSEPARETWLVLAEDCDQSLGEIIWRVASAQDLSYEVGGSKAAVEEPLTYRDLLSGWLRTGIYIPTVVGAEGIVVRYSIPIPRLSQLLRAGTFIFVSSLFLLAGSLSLAFVASYVEVVHPFNARLEALRQYARSGVWQPPITHYREHELATAAITAAVRERERAEAEAQRRLLELRAFLDSLPAYAVVKDADLRLRMVNVAMARHLGRSPEELVGKSDLDIFPDDLAQAYREHDLEVLRQKRTIQFEEEGRERGQRRFYRTVKAPILSENGTVVGLVGVAIDVTEQKALEERLIEAQKMQVVGRLAGGLCHAFNNLLTAIIGSAELALLSMEADHPAYPDVQQIRNTAERGATLSRQLMMLSQQRLGKIETINLNDLITDVEPMLRETLGEGILLQTTLAPILPPVRVDSTQLRQALLNLALNAREAMPGGGTLYIETLLCRAPREVFALEPALKRGPVICLSVRDTGVGISEEAKEHVFEPFYTTKGAAKERGLGLPVVYSIVRQHKGVILFNSEEGKGTAFMIYMPAVKTNAIAEARNTTMPEETPTGSEIVLLVEDDAMVRSLAERMLSAQGYTIWTAASGEEALASLVEKGRAPDLLLSDVIMPGISGIQLAKKLQQQYPKLKILLMSGYAGEAGEGTMEGFPILWKPFTLQALAQRVRQTLEV